MSAGSRLLDTKKHHFEAMLIVKYSSPAKYRKRETRADVGSAPSRRTMRIAPIASAQYRCDARPRVDSSRGKQRPLAEHRGRAFPFLRQTHTRLAKHIIHETPFKLDTTFINSATSSSTYHEKEWWHVEPTLQEHDMVFHRKAVVARAIPSNLHRWALSSAASDC